MSDHAAYTKVDASYSFVLTSECYNKTVFGGEAFKISLQARCYSGFATLFAVLPLAFEFSENVTSR